MIRLAKQISTLGYCSRRDAEKLILESRVKVNNQVISDVVTFVTEDDTIEVEGVMLSSQTPRLWKYYKPRGLITTHKDPQNRPTVFDNIPLKLPHIISVGRLDIESEGLLLLTNSGKISRYFELPSNNFSRVYEVKAYGKFTQKTLDKIRSGAVIEGIEYRKCQIEVIKSNLMNHWFEVTIHEGKNREIRKLFEFIGMQVSRLIRISYGKYELGVMKPGDIEELDFK